jgi:hypothetical protein
VDVAVNNIKKVIVATEMKSGFAFYCSPATKHFVLLLKIISVIVAIFKNEKI